MSSKRASAASVRRLVLGVAVSVAALAMTTGAIYALRQIAPVLSLGALYVLGVLVVAIGWGTIYAVLVSVASMLAFNFFFLPPTHTFRLRDSENWFALAVYLVIAVVVSELATRARRRTAEAEQRRREAELLAEVSALLLRLASALLGLRRPAPCARSQLADDDRDHEVDGERKPVLGVAEPEGVRRRQEEEVEREHARHRDEHGVVGSPADRDDEHPEHVERPEAEDRRDLPECVDRAGRHRECRDADGDAQHEPANACRGCPLAGHREKRTRLELPDRVSLTDPARLHDPRVHATQAKGSSLARVHEADRGVAEALGELRAAGVQLVGDFDHGGADGEPCPDREVLGAQVEVDVELISRERPPLALLRPQGDDARAHEGQLHVGMGGPVAGPAASAHPPRVADETLVQVERPLVDDLTLAHGRPPHDQLDGTRVG